MTLDPLASLSVAIAEAPGSYAFLIGSDVSSDAGVPTGQEMFWRTVADLYRTAHGAEETPGEEEVAAWLTEISRRAKLTYSEVLEDIAPDAPTRRASLAKHFEQVEPGPTYELLAQLPERGLVRVFVTTNFDRLLERALQARGIEPVVITSDADLASAPSREHADCYVLKTHGDYLRETIRNTPTELAELEPGMTTELQEVFDRHGLVVLGYSGSDEALSNALRRRTSPYGLYWVARAEPTEPARGLVEAVGGRLIVRESACEFLGDL
jgi:SIR2-like domain